METELLKKKRSTAKVEILTRSKSKTMVKDDLLEDIPINPKKNEIPLKTTNDLPRRIKVIRQLEFYFSDENLSRDDFLLKTLNADDEKSIKISEILKFKKIKELLSDIDSNMLIQINYIQYSIENHSNFIKLSTNRQKVKRIVDFNIKELNKIKEDIDSRTLYIENLPLFCDNTMLIAVFNKYAEVKLVSIPKINDHNKKIGFVTFSTKQDAEKAMGINNIVPELFLKQKYSKKQALIVKYKSEWLKEKESYKENDKSIKCLIRNNNNNRNDDLAPQTCIIMLNNSNHELKYHELKIKLSHVTQPKYIDMLSDIKEVKDIICKIGGEVILRFGCGEEAEAFVKLTENDIRFDGFKFTKMNRNEEEKYFEKVRKLREEYQLRNKNLI